MSDKSDLSEEPIDAGELHVGALGESVVLRCPIAGCGWEWLPSQEEPMLGTIIATAVRHVRGSHKEYPLDSFAWEK